MKLTKTLIASLSAIALSLTSAFAFNATSFDTGAISNGLEDFSEQLNNAIPQAATQQNVWADAWIGSLIPGIHLGGGVNFGITNVNTEGLAAAASQLGIGGINDTYKLPVFTADLRLGGLFLPFDADIAFIKTPSIEFSDISVELFTLGFDVRYAILQGGLIMPKLSVGVGYFYNQGKFSASAKDADASLEYKIHTLYLQAQLSKEFSIPVIRIGLTPFVGGRLFVSNYDNAWDWSLSDSATVAATALGKKAKDSGSDVSSGFDFNAFQPQLYLGVGLNFTIIQVTASVSIDPRTFMDDKLWTGALSLRLRH